LYKIYPYQK